MPRYLLKTPSGHELDFDSGDRLLETGDPIDEHDWRVIVVSDQAPDPYDAIAYVEARP
jgi:hypothetical protein